MTIKLALERPRLNSKHANLDNKLNFDIGAIACRFFNFKMH